MHPRGVGRLRPFAAVCVVAGCILAFLIALVAAGAGFVLRFDADVSGSAVRAVHRHHVLLTLAKAVTQFGNPITVDLVCVAGALVVTYLRRWTAVLVVAAARLLALGAEQALKYGVGRSRPHPVDPVAHAGGPSFPSGHATGIAVVATLAVVAVWTYGRGGLRWAATAVLVLIALGVAASRVLLGVHYLTDVVAGLALGTGVTAAVVAVGYRRLNA